jgi:hypothetical protein
VRATLIKGQRQLRQYIQIGAVTLAISHDPFIHLQKTDPLYRTFFANTDLGNDYSRIQIRLVLGEMPDLSRLQKLFDTRESWAIYGDNKGYWISLHPPQQLQPFWIASFDRRVDRVIVYCDFPLRTVRRKKIDLFNPICYPLDQLLLMYHLAYRDGILLHAAGINLWGRGLIFPGCSGAGKSTLARLFAACRVGNLLSDERVVVRRIAAGWHVFGTPWAGTEGIALNKGAPLSAVFFLKHGTGNHIQKIKADEALEKLLPVCSIPWYDHETMARIILICKDFAAYIPSYELSFKPDDSLIGIFEEFMLAEFGPTGMHP